jgi:inorganic pyrophosphatase
MEFQNNALFWQKIDSLFFSSELVINRPKHTTHPLYSNLIYPVDYGYLKDTVTSDNGGIDVFVGTKKKRHFIEYIIIAADILKKDVEIKILHGCGDEEINEILLFLNQTDFQKTILIKKGSEVPLWAES